MPVALDATTPAADDAQQDHDRDDVEARREAGTRLSAATNEHRGPWLLLFAG